MKLTKSEKRLREKILASLESPNKSIHIGNLERYITRLWDRAMRTGKVIEGK